MPMSSSVSDRRKVRPERFEWNLEDIVIERSGGEPERSGVGSLGNDAAKLDDDDDDELPDDELDALEALDDDHLPWDLPTEDDGSTHEYPAGQAELDEFRADDLGYNPNRDGAGRFAPGAHHEHPGHGTQQAARPWRLAFDAREHQRAIEGHKQAETVHRAASLRIKEQMVLLRQKAEAATPKERAAMQRRYKRLAAVRDQHRAAAAEAKKARVQTTKDLEQARAAHAEQRKAVVAERSEAQWQRLRQEADSPMVIGRSRIGTAPGGDAHPAAPAVHELHERPRAPESEAHAVLQRAEQERARRSAELEARDNQAAAAEKLHRDLYGNKGSTWRPGDENRTRQVVHYAEPRRTQEEWHAHDAARRAREQASDERARAREQQQAARAASPAPLPLPPAQTHSPSTMERARGFLRGLLRRSAPA